MRVWLQSQGSKPEPSGLLDQQEAIDACFATGSCEAIYAALEQRGDAWSQDTLKSLRRWVAPELSTDQLIVRGLNVLAQLEQVW